MTRGAVTPSILQTMMMKNTSAVIRNWTVKKGSMFHQRKAFFADSTHSLLTQFHGGIVLMKDQ